MISISIDGQDIEAREGQTILQVALDSGIYIPHLCYHPQLDPTSEERSVELVHQGEVARRAEGGEKFEGCNLCLVEIQGREGLLQSCKTLVGTDMRVLTESPELVVARKDGLSHILETHPHVCLLCAQAEGCDRKICSVQIPEAERCCWKFGNCEIQKVTAYIGTETGLPPYVPQNTPAVETDPLLLRDYDLCIGCLRCVRVCRDVKGADALCFTIEAGRVVVGSKGPTLRESGCLFCGYCVEVCPSGALSDKGVRAGRREVYLVPCKSRCPAEIDVPEYVRNVKGGEFEQALEVIYEKVPFPEVLGRVCFHPCEEGCRRDSLDRPVAICALKRAAADQAKKFFSPSPAGQKTEKNVGIIGSGPAGLTAAYYLRMLGHGVTVFEALPEPGGMLRVGIPPFRLPRDVLDREIKRIEGAGVEIKTDHPVDSLDGLFSEGYDAVYVAVGSHKGLKLGVPGEESRGVVDGVTFLRNWNLGLEASVGERVAVIGGGNVATDSARSALRLGAREVTLFYRRSRDEMPAYGEEIEAALEEGAKIEFMVAPGRIGETAEGVEIEFIRMRLEEIGAGRRPRPIPIEGSEHTREFDTVITAIGQTSEVPAGVDIPLGDRMEMTLDRDRGVFIGGDLLTGPKTVIDAIAAGRRGATLVDHFLGGEGDIEQKFVEQAPVGKFPAHDSVNLDRARALMPMLPVKGRVSNASEVCLGLDRQTAAMEAGRCLGCDLRFLIKPPALPPERWVHLEEGNIQGLPEAEGVYVLYDEQKSVYQITGVENIREAMREEYEKGGVARYFTYEEDEMFTSKERQLIQKYMKKHGRMPPGSDEMDELF